MTQKTTLKLPSTDQVSITTEELLLQIKKVALSVPQDSDIQTILVHVVVEIQKKHKQTIIQRRLNNTDQPMKLLLMPRSDQVECYIYILDISSQKLLEMRQYHQSVTPKLNGKENHDTYDRLGKLLKRGKNGSFRERLFKLVKDCLIYYKPDKPTKMNYLALDSITIERVTLPKEKYIFQLKVDQQVYILKALSKTDYEGWMYAIQKQSVQVKEIKLFSDYDKKVLLVQRQKMDLFKNLTTSMSQGVKQILIGSPEIQLEFSKFVRRTNPSDNLLILFLVKAFKYAITPKTNANGTSPLQALLILLDDFIHQGNKNSFLEHMKLNSRSEYMQLVNGVSTHETISNILLHVGPPYLELVYLQKFKLTGLSQSLSRIPVQRFNSFSKFNLPNFDIFYTDIYVDQSSLVRASLYGSPIKGPQPSKPSQQAE